MGTIFLVLMVGLIGYGVVCTVSGSAPSALRLGTYQPELGLGSRRFNGTAVEVQRAYVSGVRKVAGASIIDETPGVLLIDSRPTLRIMDGSFGLVVRVHFTESDGQVAVATDSCKKVSFAFVWRPEAGLREVERSIRTSAHSQGAREVI